MTEATHRSSGWRIMALLVTGAAGGAFSGIFGIGGGVAMVPLLLWLVRLDERRAAATSLAAVIPAATAGSVAYVLAGHVDVLAAVLVGLGGIVGSFAGSRLLRRVPLGWLRWGFIVILLLLGVRMFVAVPVPTDAVELGPWVIVGLVVLGVVMGVTAGLFGIGGGVLAIPVLVAVLGFSDLIARGVSLIAIVPTAVSGTVAGVRGRLVDPRDAAIVGGAGALTAIAGAAIAFLIPAAVSRALFGALVVVIAVQLTVRAIRRRSLGR